jgi:LTXXQ motif family protein
MKKKLAVIVAILFLSTQAHAQGVGRILNGIFGGNSGGSKGGQSKGGNRDDQNNTQDRSIAPARPANPADDLERQLSDLKTALKLTPVQEAAWQPYATSVWALMDDMTKASQSASGLGQTALQKVNQKVDTARNRLAALEQISDAAKKLYDSLTDDQKVIADQQLAPTVPTLYSGLAPSPPKNSGSQQNSRGRRSE